MSPCGRVSRCPIQAHPRPASPSQPKDPSPPLTQSPFFRVYCKVLSPPRSLSEQLRFQTRRGKAKSHPQFYVFPAALSSSRVDSTLSTACWLLESQVSVCKKAKLLHYDAAVLLCHLTPSLATSSPVPRPPTTQPPPTSQACSSLHAHASSLGHAPTLQNLPRQTAAPLSAHAAPTASCWALCRGPDSKPIPPLCPICLGLSEQNPLAPWPLAIVGLHLTGSSTSRSSLPPALIQGQPFPALGRLPLRPEQGVGSTTLQWNHLFLPCLSTWKHPQASSPTHSYQK